VLGAGAGEKKGLRISHLFGGLAVLGMFVTIYGLLEWYYAFDTWPAEIRTELKKAIKAKNRGDAVRSEAAFRKALEIAHELPMSALEPDPLLKLTGISISLSALLESNGQIGPSFKVLSEALAMMDRHKNGNVRPATLEAQTFHRWTEQDRIRAIGLSQKLGSLAIMLSRRNGDEYDKLAETYLVRALQEMISMASITSASQSKDGTRVVGRDFTFNGDDDTDSSNDPATPTDSIGGGKITRKGMGKTMEALADLYARRGQFDAANPLYVQAITTLLPSGGGSDEETAAQRRKATPADICQAATLMNTLSSTLLHPPTGENIKNSKAWSLRSLSFADRAIEGLNDDSPRQTMALCGRARAVAEYNLGALAEVSAWRTLRLVGGG